MVTLKELYHNPDPLVRLIGEANETEIIIENEKVKGLIDPGAQVSSISDTEVSQPPVAAWDHISKGCHKTIANEGE